MLRLLEYLAVRAFLAGLQCLPYRGTLRLSLALARFIFRFDSVPRRRTLEHLRIAYGASLSPAEIEGIARGAFETLFRHLAELAHLTRRSAREVRVENVEILREAHALGRGVVVVSAHFGCFARMAGIPRLIGVPTGVIMKRQKNDRVLQWGIRMLKQRFDLDVIVKTDARDRAGDFIKAGHLLAFYADQHPINGGFPTRFFGHEIHAARGPAVYARRLGCPLLVATLALEAGGTHVLRFDGPVSTEGDGSAVSQRWLDLLEARIREHPEQWMWMHRRWRPLRTGGAPSRDGTGDEPDPPG